MDDPKIKDDLREWLRRKLDAGKRGTRARLAEALEVDPSAISNMLSGTRDISASELIVIQGFFGDDEHGQPGELRQVAVHSGVPIVGRIGENIWSRQEPRSANDKQELVPAGDLEYPVEQQSAYMLEETTKDGDYRRGDRIYTVPFDSARSRPLIGDVVVVQTKKDGFIRFTLQKAVASQTGVVLESMFRVSSLKPAPDNEKVLELVIGFFRPHRRR